ncbi:MAG: hypothetical protein AAFS00_12545 [Bacteroidota bacterium]
MEVSLQERFIAKLEEKYGKWDKIASRFGTTPFGDISKDLSIGASQFSKLISGTATEGMYQRSIENINRLIQRESIRKALDEALGENEQIQQQLQQAQVRVSKLQYRTIWGPLFSLLIGAAAAYFYYHNQSIKTNASTRSQHPLSAFFDQDFNANFNSPYLDLTDVQDFCPASAYEGIWSLSHSYKLPIPGSRMPGVYYLARSADVRMKASRYDTASAGQGHVLMAYEHLVNEIWVDIQKRPLSPQYFDKESKTFTADFEALVFEENPNFKKVATIHSFFIDQFTLIKDSIIRKGEPYGRYASDIDEALAREFELDIKYILEHVLGDMTTASCSAIENPFCDPNKLQEKESIMTFDCIYTIRSENLGIGGGYPYQKGYRLEKQMYADNLTCNCNE